MNIEHWNQCPKVLPDLTGRECHGALDLSSVLDLTAYAEVFKLMGHEHQEFGEYAIRLHCWMPEEMAKLRAESTRLPWQFWISDGWINTTPGETVDYDFIERSIKEQSLVSPVQSIGYDPYNATQTSNNLDAAGFLMVEMRQGVQTMHQPCKEFERLVAARMLNHGNNPLLRWMARNLRWRRDANDNYMYDKKNSGGKIDGIAAAIMGIGRWLGNTPQSTGLTWASDQDIDSV